MRAGHAPVDLNIRLRDKIGQSPAHKYNIRPVNLERDRRYYHRCSDNFREYRRPGFSKTNNQRHLNQMFAENSVKRVPSEGCIWSMQTRQTAIKRGWMQHLHLPLLLCVMIMVSPSKREHRLLSISIYRPATDKTPPLAVLSRVQDGAGNWRIFDSSNTFTREAVIEEQIAVGTVTQGGDPCSNLVALLLSLKQPSRPRC